MNRIPRSRTISVCITGLTTLVALFLLVDRGGLIAVGTLILGIALLGKLWLKPSRLDPALSVGLAAIPALTWVATFYYVISTWETGEVVELAIDTGGGIHTARVWVLDIGAHPTIYYDAEPEVAQSLLAGTPLQFTRAGEVSTRIPDAVRAELLPEEQAKRVFEAMEAKYGERVSAADIYYLMLGRPGDRVAVVASLAGA